MKDDSPNAAVALDELIAAKMTAQNVVGLAVAIVNKAGETLYQGCFGCRDKAKSLPLDPETLMGIASVTKSFTALAIMQLCQRGAVDVNAPVSDYIPSFTMPGVSVGHLLSHSGGIFPQPRTLLTDVARDMALDPARDGDFALLPALADEGERRVAEKLSAQARFIGRPGEYMSYSNDGFALLSSVVKRRGGERTYPEYVGKYIHAPLGMTRSTFEFSLSSRENVTTLYRRAPGGALGETNDFTDDAFVLSGCGGMKSTLNDMKKYLCMYLNHGRTPSGEQVALPFSIKEMCRPHSASGPNAYYGYGLRIGSMDDMRVVSHGGGFVGVSSYIEFSHEAGIGAVALSNTSGAGCGDITGAAMRLFKNTGTRWSDAFIDRVCGKYISHESGAEATEIIRRGDKLVVLAGGARLEATPINSYMLSAQSARGRMLLTVYSDDGGKVWAIGVNSRIIPRSEGEVIL